jgi:hypothetical protein
VVLNWGNRPVLNEEILHNRVLPSDSPAAQFAKSLAASDPIAAAHGLWQLMGHGPRGSNHPSSEFKGRVLATLFTCGLGTDIHPLGDAWAELRLQIGREHEALRSSAGALQSTFEVTAEQVRVLQERQKSLFDELQAARQSEHATLIAKHTEQMINIEATFKRELSLRSAVEYLNTRSTEHKKLATVFGWVAAGVGAVLTGLVGWAGWKTFGATDEVSHTELAVGVLLATLAFWLLRILVRVFLSNLHLSTDMRTRATFVHTYLALINEGGAIKEEDRALVIGLVFRPTSDGLVRDDATPPGLWDLLSKRATGG